MALTAEAVLGRPPIGIFDIARPVTRSWELVGRGVLPPKAEAELIQEVLGAYRCRPQTILGGPTTGLFGESPVAVIDGATPIVIYDSVRLSGETAENLYARFKTGDWEIPDVFRAAVVAAFTSKYSPLFYAGTVIERAGQLATRLLTGVHSEASIADSLKLQTIANLGLITALLVGAGAGGVATKAEKSDRSAGGAGAGGEKGGGPDGWIAVGSGILIPTAIVLADKLGLIDISEFLHSFRPIGPEDIGQTPPDPGLTQEATLVNRPEPTDTAGATDFPPTRENPTAISQPPTEAMTLTAPGQLADLGGAGTAVDKLPVPAAADLGDRAAGLTFLQEDGFSAQRVCFSENGCRISGAFPASIANSEGRVFEYDPALSKDGAIVYTTRYGDRKMVFVNWFAPTEAHPDDTFLGVALEGVNRIVVGVWMRPDGSLRTEIGHVFEVEFGAAVTVDAQKATVTVGDQTMAFNTRLLRAGQDNPPVEPDNGGGTAGLPTAVAAPEQPPAPAWTPPAEVLGQPWYEAIDPDHNGISSDGWGRDLNGNVVLWEGRNAGGYGTAGDGSGRPDLGAQVLSVENGVLKLDVGKGSDLPLLVRVNEAIITFPSGRQYNVENLRPGDLLVRVIFSDTMDDLGWVYPDGRMSRDGNYLLDLTYLQEKGFDFSRIYNVARVLPIDAIIP